MDADREEYRGLWNAILTHVLLWPTDRIEQWMRTTGEFLLTGPDGFIFHEEPWYWVCTDIVLEFVPQERFERDRRALEGSVWFALADELQGRREWGNVDWAALREKCQEACQSD